MALWLLLNPWDSTSFGYHFAHLGIDSAGGLPAAMLRHPIDAIRPLFDLTMWGTLILWLAAFTAIAPLRAARWLLPAVPTLLIPILGSWQQADLSHLHYWHVLLPMLAVATTVGLADSPNLERPIFYLAVAGVALSWVLMPIFKPSFGQPLDDERATVAFLEQSYPEASLAALGNLVPHVSNRPEVMQLPMPFACPTVPLASFRGPDSPPQLVTVPVNLLADPLTPAAATVAETVREYYTPIAEFGDIQVWQLSREIPVSRYEIVCGAGGESSENSK